MHIHIFTMTPLRFENNEVTQLEKTVCGWEKRRSRFWHSWTTKGNLYEQQTSLNVSLVLLRACIFFCTSNADEMPSAISFIRRYNNLTLRIAWILSPPSFHLFLALSLPFSTSAISLIMRLVELSPSTLAGKRGWRKPQLREREFHQGGKLRWE